MTPWDWSDVSKQRKLFTNEDYFLWSYAMLSVTREIMRGGGQRFENGRTKYANITMSAYQKKCKNISTLDRDDRLAQQSENVCSHCGSELKRVHFDHLVPQSKLTGDYIAFNQVKSCLKCNSSKGAKDFIAWHRANGTFPTTSVLRRYIKLCYFYCLHQGILKEDTIISVQNGLPFDPSLLPRKFPKPDQLIFDYAHPNLR